jgi:hypothetical protein
MNCGLSWIWEVWKNINLIDFFGTCLFLIICLWAMLKSHPTRQLICRYTWKNLGFIQQDSAVETASTQTKSASAD